MGFPMVKTMVFIGFPMKPWLKPWVFPCFFSFNTQVAWSSEEAQTMEVLAEEVGFGRFLVVSP